MQDLDANDPTELRDGRYTLLGILGEGSMGRTYLADDSESGVRVAIKALYPSRLATAKDLQLFTREAEVLQKLDHPRIPSYIDAFDEGEGEGMQYYLVQTFVDGPTLRAKIDEGDRWTEEEVTDFARRLLTILDYMHNCDPPVVHRDIKPDNIILRADDGHPTVVDFGAVREVVRLTMGGGSTIIGTYGYMPPEQLMGRALDASDIYSVGITMLELLTRQTPQDLHGEETQRLVQQANVTEPFRRVLSRMCAPTLADRYASAAEVISDLDALGGGGALVHASRLESTIAERERQEERALKKASTPGIAHIGYIALISCIVGAAVAAVVVAVQMVATSFQGAFLIAGATSGAAMLMTLVLLGLRYTRDAWEPPTSDWVNGRGEIVKLQERFAIDPITGVPRSDSIVGYTIHYTFSTSGGEYEATTSLGIDANPERYGVGTEFDVYYRRGKPEWHELQDFVQDPDDVMGRLFDPRVVHTPE